MIGFFGLFGRSRDLQHLDQALSAVGLDPRAVPEAVKLATLSQLKECGGGAAPEPHVLTAAAELLSYCMLGHRAFTEANGASCTESVEARLATALETGDSTDARLVLLTLHAGVIQASVVERYDLVTE